jgi:hypothetical protein
VNPAVCSSTPLPLITEQIPSLIHIINKFVWNVTPANVHLSRKAIGTGANRYLVWKVSGLRRQSTLFMQQNPFEMGLVYIIHTPEECFIATKESEPPNTRFSIE